MPQTLAIRLTPKASSDRIGDVRTLPDGTEQLTVYVTAVPENGKANDAMIRLLSKYLNIPVSRLAITKGATSRNKIVQIT